MSDREAICIDIDNVLAATDAVMREVIRQYSREQVDLEYEDVVCFDYWLCRDAQGRRLHRSEWDTVHRVFTQEHLPVIRPVTGARTGLERLASKYEIHLVTSRLVEGKSATIKWLIDQDIPHDALHFSGHGEKHLINKEFAAAIDDDREQGYAFLAQGIRAFLVAHPWNRVGKYSSLIRCNTWAELVEQLLHS